jgi:hypothetical protein
LTSIERAARYLKKLGPKAALAIVPLAVVAVPANAGVVFTGTDHAIGGSPAFGGNLVSSSFGGSALPGTSVQGFRASGGAVFSFGSGVGVTLIFSASGGGSGAFGSATNPGAWNFTFASSRTQFVNWEVDYTVDGLITTATTGSSTSNPSVNAGVITVNGGAPITVDSGGTLSNWSDQVKLTWTGNNSGTMTLNVNGLDISGQDAAAPEPSTMLLTLPLAGFWLLSRRRRKA